MHQVFTSIVLPTIATGIVFLMAVAVAGWLAFRFWGYQPQGYRDRFRGNRLATGEPAAASWLASARAALVAANQIPTSTASFADAAFLAAEIARAKQGIEQMLATSPIHRSHYMPIGAISPSGVYLFADGSEKPGRMPSRDDDPVEVTVLRLRHALLQLHSLEHNRATIEPEVAAFGMVGSVRGKNGV